MKRYLLLVRQSITTLTAFEALLLGAILVLALLSFVYKGTFTVNNCLACLSAILGVFCVVLGAKGSIANWLFGIVECLLYSYIALAGHIYGDALQRLLYTLPMQFVGWHLWNKRKLNNAAAQIRTRYMSWCQRGLYLVGTAALILAVGLFLTLMGPHLTAFFHSLHFRVAADYATPAQLWLDATTTVLFLVAMFLSAKAYVEQWYIWLLINLSSIGIWVLSPAEASFMMVAKYAVYLVNSGYGLYMWHRLSRA